MVEMKFIGSLAKLNECMQEARVFADAGGDRKPYALIREAYDILVKDRTSELNKCLLCGGVNHRNSDYCCYDCAEEDGAIEK